MAITLVYGPNGSGKTFYSKNVAVDNVAWITSSIDAWKVTETEYSHYSKISKIWNDQINEKMSILFSERSSLLNNSGVIDLTGKNATERRSKTSRLLAFYSAQSFKTYKALDSFEKEYEDLKMAEKVEITDAFSMHETLKKINDLEISEEQKDAAILYSYIKSIRNQNYKSERVVSLFEKLLEIKSEIERIIKGEGEKKDQVFENLSEMGVATLLKLKDFDGSSINNEIINTLKKCAIDSEEYQQAKNLVKQRDFELNNVFLFSTDTKDVSEDVRKLSRVSEDSRTVFVDENASSGQKLVAVFQPLLKNLHLNNKEIYMDDVFEKLDTENIEKLASTIGALKPDIKMTIMTHNPFVYHQIDDVLEGSGHEIVYKKIKWRVNNNKNEPYLKNCYRSIYNFEYLNEEIAKEKRKAKTSNSEVWDALTLFSRVFARRVNRSGAVSNIDKGEEILETSNYKMYEFSSNNIAHYNPRVNLDTFNGLFSQKLETNEEVDSIWLLNKLKKKFELKPSENSLGISFEKINLFINQLVEVLEVERKTLNGQIMNWKQRQDFLEENWPNDALITKQERNARAHRLDQTLIFISETD